MEDRGKVNKNFKRLFYVILVVFISLYFAGKTGYYENRLSRKASLTKEAIKQFEKDVEDGKMVDISSYVDSNVKEYNNRYSNIGLRVSNLIDYCFNEGVSFVLKLIRTLFT